MEIFIISLYENGICTYQHVISTWAHVITNRCQREIEIVSKLHNQIHSINSEHYQHLYAIVCPIVNDHNYLSPYRFYGRLFECSAWLK